MASLQNSKSANQRELAASLTAVLSERRDHNVEAVQDTGQRLARLTQAAVECGTVGGQHARQLEQALRSTVNTEHGTRSEDAALRMYEKQTGRAVRASNQHLLIWQWPKAPGQQDYVSPLPLRRLPLRPRRLGHGTNDRTAGACAGPWCGCRRFAAVDRCRAALAMERRELGWWFRKLRAVEGREASEAHYCVEAQWDAVGLMSDLRIARGRALLAQLRECVRQRQRLARALIEAQPAVPLTPALLPSAEAAGPLRGSDWWLADEPVRSSDYHHGGSLWDIDGLRTDLAIEEHRLETLHAQVRALTTSAELMQAAAEESGAVVVESAAANTSSEALLTAVAAAEAAEKLAAEAAEAARAAAGAAAKACEEMAEEQQSFFYLAGVVDGITDEEVPTPPRAIAGDHQAAGEPSSPTGSDGWTLQEIVVEVKNRVTAISDPPPFYDQLQLVTYCLMLGCAAGDLVQCVRARCGSRIHVTRVGLNDAPIRHAEAWRKHVLPRLYAFADAVHTWRRSPSLRHAYLLASEPARRAMLEEALPHLPKLAWPTSK